MWIQFIMVFVPTMVAAIPMLKYCTNKVDGQHELMKTTLSEITRSINPTISKEFSTQSSKEVSTSKPVTASLEKKAMPSDKFSQLVKNVEQRKLENKEYSVYGYINALHTELINLDSKLRLDGVSNQDELLYTKYNPILTKIVELTAPERYGSFIQNPTHWSDAKRMINEVELAVLAVAKEATEDMRRMNSQEELNFQVSVETIIGKAGQAAKEEDPENAIKAILEDTGIGFGNMSGDLEELKNRAEEELKNILSKQKESQNSLNEAKKSLAAKARRGSQSTLEFEAEFNVERPLLFSKTTKSKSYKVHGPGSGSQDFIVEAYDLVTEQRKWKRFKSSFDASVWIDNLMIEEEKKHTYDCICMYCTGVKPEDLKPNIA